MLQGTGATAISNYLKNTLLTAVPDIRSGNIYDHELTDLAGFPAATITLQELLGRVLDNNRNERIFRFTIRIFIERTAKNFGSSKAETILRTCVNNLITTIDADPTLGGNCIQTVPFPAKFGYVDREQNDIRLVEITLDCIDANTWR